MNKRTAALLLAVACSGFTPRGGSAARRSPESAAPAPAGLWLKTVDIHRLNRDWYPERISVLSEILNRRSEPYSVTQLYFSLRMGANGRLHTELTRALKNGEDTTEKMKAKVTIGNPRESLTPEDENTYSVSISDSPFNPDHQNAVSFSASGEKQLLFGHLCHRYEFTYQTAIVSKGKSEKLTWNGMAWLEERSGLPVKLEFSVSPLPSRIRSLWAIYLYDTAQLGKWVLNKVTISGHGGFLFITKRFRTTTMFSQYRRAPHA